MLNSLERMIAWRYLRAKKEDGFVSTIAILSFLGILIGVAALIMVSAFMSGMRDNFVDHILGLNGHITVDGIAGAPVAAGDPALANLLQRTNIKALTPLVEEQVLLTSSSNKTGGMVLGVQPNDLTRNSRFVGYTISGDLENLKGWNVFLSRTLARQLDVGVGDKVNLMSPKGYETAFGWSPRVKDVTIAGVYEQPEGKPFLLMPMLQAQLLFKLKGQYTRMEITTENSDLISEDVKTLQTDLGETYRVQSWKDFYRAFVTALDLQNIVLLIIVGLIVVVAAFNIVAGQAMMVQEKGKGIAVLRTMGADKRSVMKIFVATGAMIGIVGTILGTIIGLLLTLNFETIIAFLQAGPLGEIMRGTLGFLGQISPVVSWKLVAVTFTLSICLSILATLYPAWRAANYDPVEALRYE